LGECGSSREEGDSGGEEDFFHDFGIETASVRLKFDLFEVLWNSLLGKDRSWVLIGTLND
jgi:hypothetical protein